jgi:hypothetical protein
MAGTSPAMTSFAASAIYSWVEVEVSGSGAGVGSTSGPLMWA